MNFCKDCIHFQQTSWQRTTWLRCKNPAIQFPPDPVLGRVDPLHPETARAAEHLCGKEGRRFEAKPAPVVEVRKERWWQSIGWWTP